MNNVKVGNLFKVVHAKSVKEKAAQLTMLLIWMLFCLQPLLEVLRKIGPCAFTDRHGEGTLLKSLLHTVWELTTCCARVTCDAGICE